MEVDVDGSGGSYMSEEEQLFSMSREALVQEVLLLRKAAKEHRIFKGKVEFQMNILKCSGHSVICTDLSGIIMYWNKAATMLYGWEEDEAIGQNLLTFLPALTLAAEDRGQEVYTSLLQGQKWKGQASVCNKRGEILDVMVINAPLVDDEGGLAGMIGVSTDIMDVKRKEQEILRLNAELEHRVVERTQQLRESNERLRKEAEEHLEAKEHLQAYTTELEQSQEKVLEQAGHLAKVIDELSRSQFDTESASRLKSRFLASVSHEIRTPMNGIMGMTNLMLATELSEDQVGLMNTIRTSGDALLAIIDDILDFSKIEAGEMLLQHRSFSFMQCLEDAVDLLAAKATEKNLEVSCYVDSSVPEVSQSDPSRLRQVIVNLVSNAVKFTESGEIAVRASAEPWASSYPEPPVNPPAPGLTPSHCLTVSVRDTGIGIPGRAVDRLFQPFCQLDTSATRRFGGTGLGLIISRQLAEMLGGRLWVQSEGANQGSTFHFSVALYPPSTPNPRGSTFGRSQIPSLPASSAGARPTVGSFLRGPGPGRDPHAWLSASNRSLHSALRVQSHLRRGSKGSGLSNLQRRHSCGVSQLRRLLEASNAESAGYLEDDPGKVKASLLNPNWVEEAPSPFKGSGPDEEAAMGGQEPVETPEGLRGPEPWISPEPTSKPLAKAHSLPSMSSEAAQEVRALTTGISPLSDSPPPQQKARQPGAPPTYGSGRKRLLVQGSGGQLPPSDRRRARLPPPGVTPLVPPPPPSQEPTLAPLPALTASWPKSPMPTPSSAYSSMLTGRTVLLVDGSSTVRCHLSSYLQELGMRSVALERAEEAVPLLASAPGRAPFHVIVLAHGVPGSMDGIATARQLYQTPAGRSVPIILLCKYGSTSQLSLEGTNVMAVLSKPVRQTHLRRAVASAVQVPVSEAQQGSGPQGGTRENWVRERKGSLRQPSGEGFRTGMGNDHPLRILLVEDNLVNQKVAIRMLRQLAYSCDVAANGMEALSALEKQRYDLVFMDIQMPVMDGIEATQQILKRWPANERPRIVAMTANVLHSDKKLCLEVGMDGFVSKPINVHDLVAALERTTPMKEAQLREGQDSAAVQMRA